MNTIFPRIALWTAHECGKAHTFAAALLLLVAWGATGPVFHYDDTWQLVANTATSLITFLMVFLLQHSQTRDALAVQAKLDELIRVTDAARDQLIGLERKTEEEQMAIATLSAE